MTQDDHLRFEVTTSIHRIGRNWRKLVRDAIVGYGISEACALPLATIARLGDGTRQGTIAEEIGIEGPSLVRLLDQLSTCGLVERRDDPDDRRAKTLWLTPEGRKVTRQVESDLVTLRRDLLGHLGEDDLQAFLRVAQALEAAVQDTQAPAAEPNDPGGVPSRRAKAGTA